MKVAFLSTGSGETEKYAASLKSCIACELTWLRYDAEETEEKLLYQQVKDVRPDLIV